MCDQRIFRALTGTVLLWERRPNVFPISCGRRRWSASSACEAATRREAGATETNSTMTLHGAYRPSSGVLFALLQRIAKITVTGALHDRVRPGELHVGTKAFCMGKIRTTSQQESQFRGTD